MAEETGKTTEPAEAPKGGLAGKLPLVGGIAAGLAMGATVGLMVLGPRLSASPAPAHAAAAAAKEGDGAPAGEGKKADESPIYQLDNMVLNPAGSNGAHFLLMSVALQVKDAATLELLKSRDAEMRDAILRLFGNKTVEQVSDASTRDQLRSELMAALGEMLPPGAVRKVYFPQFVIQ